MLYFSRWKATAVLLTALIVCLFAVPNFFPDSVVAKWPRWAQRQIVLGLDLQGGSHILLEVDFWRGPQGKAGGLARRCPPRAPRNARRLYRSGLSRQFGRGADS